MKQQQQGSGEGEEVNEKEGGASWYLSPCLLDERTPKACIGSELLVY